ncbi:MAG: hypothetical protein KQJ78_21085 [Deltaproteobacteria bacterium]|nr:hypothetical protein [Deltaproteobacteria bacterium]
MPSTSPDDAKALEDLLALWPENQLAVRDHLLALKAAAEALPGAVWSFLPRPGVSYSLRFTLDPAPVGRTRPVFFLVDTVPLAEDEFLLSVCFYEDEITDPEERGNAIPQGLFNETGYCFDMDEEDEDLLGYCLERLKEAHGRARGE